MGQLVYILGRSGTGKSYSLRNFPKDQLAVINVQGKMLPFKGASAIEQTPTDNSANILKALDIYAAQYKSIVVDDYQYVMSNEFMRRSAEKGYDKFTEIARHAWDIANKVRELPDDVIVYIMCHTDRDDDGNEKIKTIGRLLDEKICLEGLSTIVLKTNVSDGQYTFLTQNNGKDTVKSPFGMFPTYAIDNDLYYVDQKIRNYYEMGDFTDDQTIEKMDQAAAKEEISKPDPSGRRSRRKQAAENTNDTEAQGSGTADGQRTVSESAPSAGTNTEPKEVTSGSTDAEMTADQAVKTTDTLRRKRKVRDNGQAQEEKPAEAPAEETQEATEAAPRRRRRKASTLTAADFEEINDDVDDVDLPF